MGSVFLSYAGADRQTATRIRNGLEAAGLKMWQDLFEIRFGDNWVDELQEALVKCSGFVILIGPSGISYWANKELSFAFKRQGDEGGKFSIFPLLLPGVTPEGLPAFLSLIQAAQIDAEPTHEDFCRLVDQMASGVDELTISAEPADRCPFAGLESFDEENAGFFAGRESETLEALSLFGHLGKGAERRWLQVEGPSGVGKSSLVKAGIIPAIRVGWVEDRRQLRKRNWWIVLMRPGHHPILNLAEKLSKLFKTLDGGPSLDDIRERLEKEYPGALRDLIREYLPERSRFLLVLDQLEEVFTLTEGRYRRSRLDTLVASALKDRDGQFHLITTIRSDYTIRFGDLPQLESMLNQRAERYYLRPMGEAGLRVAVGKPMRRVGLQWDEPTLGARIAKSAAGESNALPLVSKLLWLLWQRRDDGNRLLARIYEDLGGVGGALAQSADDLLGSLGNEGKRRARDLLLNLVWMTPNSQPIRRTISRTTALAAAGGGAEAERVLNRLAGGHDSTSGSDAAIARLIVISDRPTDQADVGTQQADVDLVHEALLTQWDRLKGWIEEHRELLLASQALEGAAKDWRSAGRPRFPGVTSRLYLKRYRRVRTPSELAQQYLRAVRRQIGFRSFIVGIMALVVTTAITFGVWINKEGISIRSGFYLLLASVDLYYLQPEMVNIPAGQYLMGALDPRSSSSELKSDPCGIARQAYPLNEIAIDESFSIGKYEVTFDEYDVFARLNDHIEIPSDYGWGRGRRPVIDVSWEDAVAYAQWLSEKTGKSYRLPSEAEWEYAARAESTTAYWWGHVFLPGKANCWNCGIMTETDNDEKQTVSVGSFPANNFGLHDTAGNVWEWVQDCWHKPKDNVPNNASAKEKAGCNRRVLRGGAWNEDRCNVRSAIRKWGPTGSRFESGGFRLAR